MFRLIAESDLFNRILLPLFQQYKSALPNMWRKNLIDQYGNPIKPELTTVILIHYKPRIAAAILEL